MQTRLIRLTPDRVRDHHDHTRAEHQVFTNAWRQAIPHGSRNVTPNMVNNTARNIYSDYPEILRALGLG